MRVIEEHQAVGQVPEQTFEALSLVGGVVIDAAGKQVVAHDQRGLAREGGEELEVIGAEGDIARLRVQVEHAEHRIAVDHGHAHHRARAAGTHRLRAGEPQVLARIGGEQPGLLGDHLVDHGS